MRHTEVALRRPVTTVVVFVALALVGLIASRLLPLEKFPDIEFPGIFIQIPYEGSTPEEVERLITRPVEEALATLAGVERMFSSSSESQAQVFLQFGWDESMGTKGIEARAKVDGIRHLLFSCLPARWATNRYCSCASRANAICRVAMTCSTACSNDDWSDWRACRASSWPVWSRVRYVFS